ncbi:MULTISPECIES: very short patch repair endonuclease [unclassified Rhodanobacter]|uniref:Very short patch repair endonuclease n=1 Tax=Rhodanobacter humi TaxID=1888173 RepID=A0ABV4APP7_9GAMM
MTDIVDRATRSRMMSGIRGCDTKPEVIVRKYLHAHGLRYRIAPKNLPGKPDIVLPKYRTVVFVHGCFWHRHPRCRYATTPATNKLFWMEKFKTNTARDRRVQRQLRSDGWRILVVWECQCSTRDLHYIHKKIVSNQS